MAETIGFIGVGAMGLPLAERLLAGGHPLTVLDLRHEAMAPLLERGARAGTSPRAVAEESEIVFSCLPSGDAVRTVAFGSDGVIEGAAVKTYVETSTVGARVVRDTVAALAPRGIAVLDAPVSGGPRGARAGTLSLMVAGAPATFARTKPVLALLGKNVFYVAERPGLAQVMKLANNIISAAGMAAACEAVVMGVKAGLDAETMIRVINASTGRNSATLDKFPTSILTRTFDYGGKTGTMEKDVRLCLEQGEELGVPMWVGSRVGELWAYAVSQGAGDWDYTSLIRHIEQWAGVEVGGGRAT